VNAAAGGLAAFVLTVAGCGAQDQGAATGSGSSSSEPVTSLTVVVSPTGADGPSVTTTLECDPVGGSNPLSKEACDQLAAHPDAFEPIPADAACTMQAGGPEVARVYGTFQGEAVDATFNRTNGCEITRWDSLEPIFKVVVD